MFRIELIQVQYIYDFFDNFLFAINWGLTPVIFSQS